MDDLIRNLAFTWLEEQTNVYGEVLPRSLLEAGFEYKGQRITLLGPSGIWKPKVMDLPLSITTILNGPYADAPLSDGFLKYDYRGTDPYHRDNVGLRELMFRRKPIIYFHSIIKGKYLATWPVYIIYDNISELNFTVAVDNVYNINTSTESKVEDDSATYYRRSYLTSNIRVRLHQQSFRERVLLAYQNQCTLCRLKHAELLDAAHIIGDKDDLGDPIVQNGLALCKIHHAAYDKNIIGINPDYQIKIRRDILEETDGPMLRYGIQSLENARIILPKHQNDWPDKERLEYRFDTFLRAV
jgi:putative restriction endonuclease